MWSLPTIEGGPKAKRTPFGKRRRHGELEKQLLSEVIDSDMLFYFSGTKVMEFQRRVAALYGRRHCIACSSGTASVHIAVAALQLPPGSEVIVPAITDMGTLTGVLYQGLIPVFADVQAGTLNMDPDSVREKVSDRTKAILAVHHAGLAAESTPWWKSAVGATPPSSRTAPKRISQRAKGAWRERSQTSAHFP